MEELDIALHIKTVMTEGNTGTYEIEVEACHSLWLANALRRVLLSSLPGAAITSLRIEGVLHEFQDIPDVKEDVTELVQNIKKVRLRSFADRPVPLYLDAQGECHVTAGNIVIPGTIEIVNPDLHLATLDNENACLHMELVVETGRGFVSAELQAQQNRENQPIGVIMVDAIYAPVLKVNFTIEHTRVERLENLDTVTLQITTDGTISPDEALRESADLLRQQFAVFAQYYPRGGLAKEKDRTASDVLIPQEIYSRPIEDLGISFRAYNCLRRVGIKKVGQLLEMDGKDILCIRNLGEKSLQELSERLQAKGFLPVSAAK